MIMNIMVKNSIDGLHAGADPIEGWSPTFNTSTFWLKYMSK